MSEIYPGADQDEKDGYIHDTVPARLVPSNLSSIDRARLLAGLSELSQAFVKGEQGRYGMRIPAEPYRDGDLVCGGAMRLIGEQNAEIERLRAALESVVNAFYPLPAALREACKAALTAETPKRAPGDLSGVPGAD